MFGPLTVYCIYILYLQPIIYILLKETERVCFKKETKQEVTIIVSSVKMFAGPRNAVGRAPDSLVRGPGFDTRSGHILLFLLPLFQERQLSVTGESMCTKYWLTAYKV